MSDFSIGSCIFCAICWGAIFGMNINRRGVIKWLDAILTISYALLAISGIMAR